MLCREDKRVYRLREKSMAKLMSKYLRCDVSDLVEDLEKGDVAETCAKFFEKEGEPKKFSSLSLKQVDDLLEKLTKSGKEDEQLAVLRCPFFFLIFSFFSPPSIYSFLFSLCSFSSFHPNSQTNLRQLYSRRRSLHRQAH
jgi:hypothetical protein